MKITDIGVLSHDELIQKERDLKKELFNLKFRHRMGEIENPMRIRQIKRDIARVKTFLRELQIKDYD